MVNVFLSLTLPLLPLAHSHSLILLIGIADWSAELYFYHDINIPNKRTSDEIMNI